MTQQSPLAIIDSMFDPIIVAANKIRQLRDSLPEAVWLVIPIQFRGPLDALFMACENYDRKIGLMKASGLDLEGVGTDAPD